MQLRFRPALPPSAGASGISGGRGDLGDVGRAVRKEFLEVWWCRACGAWGFFYWAGTRCGACVAGRVVPEMINWGHTWKVLARGNSP
jgi:hypothetical protein